MTPFLSRRRFAFFHVTWDVDGVMDRVPWIWSDRSPRPSRVHLYIFVSRAIHALRVIGAFVLLHEAMGEMPLLSPLPAISEGVLDRSSEIEGGNLGVQVSSYRNIVPA